MRNAFASEITELAGVDDRVTLLSGDIGNRMFDSFKEKFPKRFLNCGVAEANMTGMAAGMAMCGLRPVTYTIAPFATTRCLEQIRVDLCCHKLPVVIAGVGAGLSYASLGPTHHSCEDLAFLRSLPGMTVLCPGDSWEVAGLLRAAMQHDGPVYLRLGKKNEPKIHDAVPDLEIGKGFVLQEGRDVCLLSVGTMLPVAVEAAERLAQRGLSVKLVSLHTVKPLDESLLADAFSKCDLVASIEEHSLLGGLGGAVAEWLADHDQGEPRARLLRFGTPDTFAHSAGSLDDLRREFGLDGDQISRRILDALDDRRGRQVRDPAA
ncbi:MAG: hypothetical protein N2C14_19525 [Planctomycetales bacterium]